MVFIPECLRDICGCQPVFAYLKVTALDPLVLFIDERYPCRRVLSHVLGLEPFQVVVLVCILLLHPASGPVATRGVDVLVGMYLAQQKDLVLVLVNIRVLVFARLWVNVYLAVCQLVRFGNSES